jgi:lysophospholipase L1-like esterase
MKKPRILIVGDSTAQTNDITSYPQTGWGQTLSLYLKKETLVFNFAKNGQSSKSFFDSGQFKPVQRHLSKRDILLIQFGHNDQKTEAARHTEPGTTYKEYLTKYIDCARLAGAFPVLMTSITRRQFLPSGHLNAKTHFDYPDAVKALAKEKNVPLIDMYAISWSYIDTLGDELSKPLFMHLKPGLYERYPEGLSDNTHFVYEGAVKMAGFIAEGLKTLGSPYSDPVL